MNNLISIFLIGIALSMDTFSLSLSLGTFNVTNKKALKLSFLVGIMHFIMPFLGMLIGGKLTQILELKSDILLGFILIIIAIEMLIDIIKGEEEKFNYKEMIEEAVKSLNTIVLDAGNNEFKDLL